MLDNGVKWTANRLPAVANVSSSILLVEGWREKKTLNKRDSKVSERTVESDREQDRAPGRVQGRVVCQGGP